MVSPMKLKKTRLDKNKPKARRVLWWLLSLLFFFVIVLPVIALLGFYLYFSSDLPRLNSVKDYKPKIVTQVFSEGGDVIAEFFVERRYVIPLEQMSTVLVNAFIAAEDERFFEHQGIDVVSIMRALIKNMRSMDIVQGGSTITQQVTKSLLLTSEKSYARKIKEAILAYRIERSLSKTDILTIYLNQIYLGHRSYGVEAAAQTYFCKPAADLNVAEAALLAGLPKAPSAYSPLRHPDRAKRRQQYVLERMVESGYITESEAKEAEAFPLKITAPENKNITIAPYIAEYIRQYIQAAYGTEQLYGEGLKVYTPVNLLMQDAAQRAVEAGLKDFEKRQGYKKGQPRVQGALVALEPQTGSVKALIGGMHFLENQFNRVMQARRQPGSAFKPIVYAAALDKAYTTASMITDAPLIFPVQSDKPFWEPRNFDLVFEGPVTFRHALSFSRNIITVKILHDIGVRYVIDYAKKLGVSSPLEANLSLALGSSGVSLLELTRAYAVFASQGLKAEPLFITRIVDRTGMALEENKPRLSQAISPQTAYLMTSLLQSVVEEGTGRGVKALERPCAAKTGTTNDVRDAWFIGYTPDLIVGTWVGFDIEKPLGKRETGAVAAGPIWLRFMQEVLEGTPKKIFPVPEGIIFRQIDKETGRPPTRETRNVIFECFKDESAPDTL